MSDKEKLTDLLLRWEELHDQGRDVPATELCQDCPDLAPKLARHIHALKKTAWLKEPLEDTDISGHEPLAADQPRTLLNRYRLEERLGEGGFGAVWRGFDLELQRSVAVKISKRHRQEQMENLLAEARKVARLRHPHIVPVYDVGRDENSHYFIVSDLIDGMSLTDRIRQDRPAPREAARIVAEVAEAIAYAHQNGILAHFDLKPENILIDSQGRAFLTDFGVALTDVDFLREKGKSLGTLAYASPEQLAATTIDARTDVYSLGAVLFELLTGCLPFSDDNPAVLRERIVSQEVPRPRSIDGAIPEGLEIICVKCLAKQPEDRYETAQALADALRVWLNAPPGKNRRWHLATVVGALAIMGAAGYFFTQQKQQAVEAKAETTAIDNGADHRAAAWVIRCGGSVNSITNPANIPESRFKIEVIQLQGSLNAKNNPDVTDAGLAHLQGLAHLHSLNLAAAKIDGTGLKYLSKSTNLRWLSLEGSHVNDNGVAHLAALENLRYLNLLLTPITDASVPHLARLKNLEHLVLLSTKVSEAGVKDLQTALPKCNILR